MFKWSMNERLKNCLVGFTLILSISVIVFPSLFKNETVYFDDTLFSSTHTPAPPRIANVKIPDRKTLFKTVKVAHVNIPSVNNNVRELALAETNKYIAKGEDVSSQVALASENNNFKKEQYAVQLASFSQINNAKSMVQLLKDKGFSAYYSKQGNSWRVLVGQMERKHEALHMQQKLARKQLSGYVVKLA